MSQPKDDKRFLTQNLTTDRSEDIFASIVSNFPDIIHSVDKTGTIIAANNKAT